jgi:hypothetical protein
MEGPDEDVPDAEMIPTDDPEAIVAFWKGEFAKFLYAKTESEAAAALAGALRSEWAMPDDFRLILAGMLEGVGVRLTDPSWTIRAVRRRDEKLTKVRITAWKHYREVQELINNGMLMTVACKEVARRRNKEQRAIEITYKNCAETMYQLVGEPRKRAEAASRRSKALRQTLRDGSQLEDDQGS